MILPARLHRMMCLAWPTSNLAKLFTGMAEKEFQCIAPFYPQFCKRRPVADKERVLAGHALVDPVSVFPRFEGCAELRVCVHVPREREGGRMRQGHLTFCCGHDFRRRAAPPPATTPSLTIRAYSSIMASIVADRGTPRFVMTELHKPSSASVASFGSRSARNSPAAMPSRNKHSIRFW